MRPSRWRRRLLWTCLLLLLAYAGLVTYLFLYQADLIFRPPRQGALYARSLDLAPERLVLRDAHGLATIAWRIRATAPSPYWIVYLHGNSASIATGGNVVRYHQLRSLGVNLLAPEYPGFGEVGGQASQAGLIAAARAAYEHVRHQEGAPPDAIAIYGWSLGSGGAVPVAREVDEAALVLEGAFTSVLRRARAAYPFIPITLVLQHPFLSEEAMPHTGSPTLFLHSPTDTIIPFEDGRQLYERARGRRRLVELRGGHIVPNQEDADVYASAIHRFLTEEAGWQLAPPRRSVGLEVRRVLERDGLAAALEAYRRCRADGDTTWNLAEYELDYLGRRLSDEERHAEAVALLRLNAEQFPDSPLAWYSLGRALTEAGQDEAARQAFARSIAIEPAALNPSHGRLARIPG